MAKEKKVHICSVCGYESLKWMGKCPECGEWNSFTEETVHKNPKTSKTTTSLKPVKISEITYSEKDERLITGISEFDRVLGGGFVPGSVTLLGGDPGIGKSTLVLQTAGELNCRILYVSGEESLQQIKLRASRLDINKPTIELLPETNVVAVSELIEKSDYNLVVIDSIQTMFHPDYDNTPGSITQIRESAYQLQNIAKKTGVPVVLVGHITKEGSIAGPKILEHTVDTVLQFEGDKNSSYRILRSLKNRFGSTNEIGIFEMLEAGLKEVKNPSEIFLSNGPAEASGSVITSTLEGSRAILIEVQALVTPAQYGNPQRVATGFDYKRLSILLAVLERRYKLKLSAFNVFLNITGGIRIEETAIDLAVCMAIASNMKEITPKNKPVILGEVGLGGEIRGVANINKRISEAVKLGYTNLYVPFSNLSVIDKNLTEYCYPVKSLKEIADLLLR
ncbi:MAG: DNA repair protein RadA [Melioribacteraceae bacterium]|nr:MAG: DNA repair protein RadA [Melioribacteraceae bacterium]